MKSVANTTVTISLALFMALFLTNSGYAAGPPNPEIDVNVLSEPLVEPVTANAIIRANSTPNQKLYDVPVGYVLVIEYVSFFIEQLGMEEPVLYNIEIAITYPSSLSFQWSHYLNIPLVTSGTTRQTLNAGQVTRIYAEPETSVWVRTNFPSSPNTAYTDGIVTISGRLIPAE